MSQSSRPNSFLSIKGTLFQKLVENARNKPLVGEKEVSADNIAEKLGLPKMCEECHGQCKIGDSKTSMRFDSGVNPFCFCSLPKDSRTVISELESHLKESLLDKELAEEADLKERDESMPFSGLFNLGNTCYVNTLLQLLYSIPEIVSGVYEYYMSCFEKHGEEIDNLDDFILSLAKTFAEMKLSKKESIDPVGFLDALVIDKTTQQDLPELFNLLLPKMKIMFKELGLESPMQKIFVGTARYETSCKKCDRLISKGQVEEFVDIRVFFQGSGSLLDALKKRFEDEDIDEDFLKTCLKCGKDVNVTRRYVHEKTPPVVQILTQLISYDAETNMKRKGKKTLQIPITLSPYTFEADSGELLVEVSESDGEMPIREDELNSNYQLYSIIRHSGVADSGHYELVILGDEVRVRVEKKEGEERQKPQIFWEISDNRVTRVGKVDKLDKFLRDKNERARAKHIDGIINDRNAYIVTYIRSDYLSQFHEVRVDIPSRLVEHVKTQNKKFEEERAKLGKKVDGEVEILMKFHSQRSELRSLLQDSHTHGTHGLDRIGDPSTLAMDRIGDPSTLAMVPTSWLEEFFGADLYKADIQQILSKKIDFETCEHEKMLILPKTLRKLKFLTQPIVSKLSEIGVRSLPTFADACVECLQKNDKEFLYTSERLYSILRLLLIQKSSDEKKEGFYISKEWINAFKNFEAVPRSFAVKNLCPHGKICSISSTSKERELASEEVLNYLNIAYEAGELLPSKVFCEVCKSEMKEKEISKKKLVKKKKDVWDEMKWFNATHGGNDLDQFSSNAVERLINAESKALGRKRKRKTSFSKQLFLIDSSWANRFADFVDDEEQQAMPHVNTEVLLCAHEKLYLPLFGSKIFQRESPYYDFLVHEEFDVITRDCPSIGPLLCIDAKFTPKDESYNANHEGVVEIKDTVVSFSNDHEICDICRDIHERSLYNFTEAFIDVKIFRSRLRRQTSHSRGVMIRVASTDTVAIVKMKIMEKAPMESITAKDVIYGDTVMKPDKTLEYYHFPANGRLCVYPGIDGNQASDEFDFVSQDSGGTVGFKGSRLLEGTVSQSEMKDEEEIEEDTQGEPGIGDFFLDLLETL